MLYLKELDHVLKQLQNKCNIAAMAVGIIKENDILFEQYYGLKDVNNSESTVDKNTLFCMVSISKMYVASYILKLQEDNLLSINDPITKFIPNFKLKDTQYNKITIKHLLSHTSGIPDISEIEYDSLVKQNKQNQNALEEYILSLKDKSLLFEVGTKYSYSNIGYSILGYIISKITNKSFELATDDYFKSIKLFNTTFNYPDLDKSLLAKPHLLLPNTEVSKYYPYDKGDAPSSFIHSTLNDSLLFTKYLYNNEYILNHMNNKITKLAYDNLYDYSGIGCNIGNINNDIVLSHGGYGFGFSSFIMILPKSKIAIVILTTQESFIRAKIINLIESIIKEEKPIFPEINYIVTLNNIYLKHGKDALYKEIKSYISDYPDKINLLKGNLTEQIFALIYGERFNIAKDYLEVYNKFFDQDLELIDYYNKKAN